MSQAYGPRKSCAFYETNEYSIGHLLSIGPDKVSPISLDQMEYIVTRRMIVDISRISQTRGIKFTTFTSSEVEEGKVRRYDGTTIV